MTGRLLTHLKPVVAGNRELAGLNPQHLGTRWALLTPGPQFRDGHGSTFSLHLHGAVLAVANPAAQPQVKGAAVAAGPESNALDLPLDDQAPAFDEGLDALRSRPADEALADGIGPVASASRHRQQIVEQLAQCM